MRASEPIHHFGMLPSVTEGNSTCSAPYSCGRTHSRSVWLHAWRTSKPVAAPMRAKNWLQGRRIDHKPVADHEITLTGTDRGNC
jgi:hypothetical protein